MVFRRLWETSFCNGNYNNNDVQMPSIQVMPIFLLIIAGFGAKVKLYVIIVATRWNSDFVLPR